MTLEQRVEKLERQNRLFKRLGALALAVGAVVFLAAQAKEKEPQDLVVRSLRITDGARLRAEFGVRDECSYLELYDKAESSRVALFGDYHGLSSLLFSDKAGKTKLSLGVAGDGSPHVDLKGNGLFVHLSDSGGKTRVSVEVTADGTPSLRLLDTDGKVIWKSPGE